MEKNKRVKNFTLFMKIVLCSSAKYFDKLIVIQKQLEKKGHEVLLPSMEDYHHLEETALAKIQCHLIKEHFHKINESDAIYIANYDKNDIEGYIGGNSFLEMGKAFDMGIPIFLMKDIPKGISYREEILALQPIVIGEDFDKINHSLRKINFPV